MNLKLVRENAVTYILSVFVLLVVIDSSTGYFLKKMYLSERSVENSKFLTAFSNTQAEGLIFGSSRALHHYNPSILQDSLGVSFFNMGQSGQNIYFHLALLKENLKRYEPKIVLLELGEFDFVETPSKWDTERLNVFLPLASSSDIAYNTVLRRGSSERIKMLLSSYTFNSTIHDIILNLQAMNEEHKKGHIALNKEWSKELKEVESDSVLMDDNKLKAIYEFIELSKKADAKVYVLISPIFRKFIGEDSYNDVSKLLSDNCDIQILNYRSDSLFLSDKSLFVDPSHLNTKGSIIYSQIIANKLKTFN